MQGNPTPLFLQMSEDTDNTAGKENVEKHLQKGSQ